MSKPSPPPGEHVARRVPSAVSLEVLAVVCASLLVACRATIAAGQTCAYIANNGSNSVSVIDTATRTVTRNIAVGPHPTLPVVAPDGRTVYVTVTDDFDHPDEPDGVPDAVAIIETETGAVSGYVPVGDGPKGIAIVPGGHTLFVANTFSDTVSVVDVAAGVVVETLTVGHRPEFVAISPDGDTVYVANSGSRTLSIIDTGQTAVTATVGLGSSASAVAAAPDGQLLWIAQPGSATLSAIDMRTLLQTATLALRDAPAPTSIAVAPDSRTAYITGADSNLMVALDLQEGAAVRTIAVGEAPRGAAITHDGSAVYVANALSDTVSIIDTATQRVTTVAVGHAPSGIGIAAVSRSCPPPVARGLPTSTPSPLLTVTPTPTPTRPAPSCCYCPNRGGREDCADPMAGGCADDCFLLPNAMCVNPGTTLANCEVSDQTPPPTNTPTETPTPGLACAGDCSGTLTVGAADLRTGIAFIFDPQFETSCPLAVFDWDDDGDVTAAEFLDAVRSAAFGCGAD